MLFKSFVIVSLLLTLLLSGCAKKSDDIHKKAKEINYAGPVLTVDNLTVSYSDSGRVKVKMNTAKHLKYANGNDVYPKAIFVNFLDKNSVEYSSLRGDSGHHNAQTNLYVLKGNVFFQNRLLQQSMQTEELFWNPNQHKVYSNKKVTIKTPRESVTAIGGFEALEDFSKYTLTNASGVFLVDSINNTHDNKGSYKIDTLVKQEE